MELSSIVIAAAIIFCFLFLCFYGARVGRFFYLTSKIGGPSLWQLLTVHTKPLLGDDMVSHLTKLCASYDYKPFGLWLANGNYFVILSDSESVNAIYKNNNLNDKSHMLYDQVSEFLGKSLLTMNCTPRYSLHRKVFGRGLKKSFQGTFLPKMPTNVSEFIDALHETAADGREVDVRDLVLSQVMATMLVSMTTVSHATVDPFIHKTVGCINSLMDLVHVKAMNPVYYWLFRHFRSSSKQTFDQINICVATLDDIIMAEKSRAISSNLKDSRSAQYMCQAMMLSYLNSQNAGEVNNTELCDIFRTLFIAGVETTSFTLNTLLLVLALHQDIQQRVLEEVDSVLGEGPVLSADLDRLAYMDMVIKETLRLFPPGAILGRSVAEDTNVNGVMIPAGANLAIHVMALHRNPELYPDPLKFDPSRFSSEESSRRRPYSYLPFSAGVRSCPGSVHAYVMMKLLLCHILKNFRILPGDKLRSLDDIKVKMSFTTHLEESSLRLVKRRQGIA